MNQLSANKVDGKDVFKSKTFVFGFLGVNLVDVEKSILSTKLADKTKQRWFVKNSREDSNIASGVRSHSGGARICPQSGHFLVGSSTIKSS